MSQAKRAPGRGGPAYEGLGQGDCLPLGAPGLRRPEGLDLQGVHASASEGPTVPDVQGGGPSSVQQLGDSLGE